MILRSSDRSVHENISQSWTGDWKGAGSWRSSRYWSTNWSELWKSWSRSGKNQIVVSKWRALRWHSEL